MDVDDAMTGVYTRLPAEPSVTIGGASTAIEANCCGAAPVLAAPRDDPGPYALGAGGGPVWGSGERVGCG